MKALAALALRAKSLTIDELILELSKHRSFTDFIIELNTKKQLFEKGVNADNVKLSDIGGDYSPYTLELHPEKVADIITLYDTGDFYNSFRVFYLNGTLTISADTIKDTTDLIREWGDKILGLNEDSLKLLRDKAKEIIIPYVKKRLLTRNG